MDNEMIIAEAEQFVRNKLAHDFSGHDWWHIDRVRNNAVSLAHKEHADVFLCELTALLHDLTDEKLCDDELQAEQQLKEWLVIQKLPNTFIDKVLEIISTMSFKGGSRPPMKTLEGKIVQDADRLDAIGAVGISRVFAYSGAKGRPIHDPTVKPREAMTKEEYRSGHDTAINHFYEKLLKLKSLMNTEHGKQMAEHRHTFMEQYLQQFYGEWDGLR
ncbi:MAG: HD domain-containing protein [Paenibacillaceae bacterium]